MMVLGLPLATVAGRTPPRQRRAGHTTDNVPLALPVPVARQALSSSPPTPSCIGSETQVPVVQRRPGVLGLHQHHWRHRWRLTRAQACWEPLRRVASGLPVQNCWTGLVLRWRHTAMDLAPSPGSTPTLVLH